MAEVYELTRLLEEIMEDEKVGASKKKKISQAEIRKLLVERQQAVASPKDSTRQRLGEALVQKRLITPEQLKDALALQKQKGGKIGSILVELGHISAESLLEFLERQHGTKGTNLLKVDFSESAMAAIPLRLIQKYMVLPIRVDDRSINLAMENPGDFEAIHEIEFLTGKRVNPVVVPSYQMELAIKCMEQKGGLSFSATDMQYALKGPLSIHDMLLELIKRNGSDLLITAGTPPSIKVQNTLWRTDMPMLTPEQCVAHAKSLMTERQWEEFLTKKELDFAISFNSIGRFRCNAYRQKNTISIAMRRILDRIPTFEELGLPALLREFALKPQGLILITGPTGHGKTTTLAAIANVINSQRRCNIISLEDPIEYLHDSQKSNFNQREIGTDTYSFSEGLKRIFRQTPDVILIGELRDAESTRIAITAACTGHLVLSSMQSSNATSAIETLIAHVPEHLRNQVRSQLAEALLIIISQRLLPKRDSEDLVLAYEKLISSYRIKNFIRENKIHQIRSHIQNEADDFSSLDSSIIRLVKEGKISMETGLVHAENTDFVLKMGVVD